MRGAVVSTARHPRAGTALQGGLMVAALTLALVAPIAAAAPPVVRQDAASGPDLETRLARVERVVGGQGLLDLLSQVERLNREVKQLRGELESQGHTLGQVQLDKRRLEAEVATLKAGLAGMAPGLAAGGVPGGILPGAATADAPSAPVVGDAPATPATAPITAPPVEAPSVPLPPVQALAGPAELPQPVSPDLPVPEPVVPADAPVAPPVAAVAPDAASPDEAAAYREAFSLLKAGEYDQAIAGFEAYLASFPTGPNADNAQYWLGEAHHVNRRFEPAIAHYRQLVANFPQSAKLTHARLKIGDCLYELGRREEAEQELKALVAEHPTSTAARLAEERLERWRLTRG
ncbi:MAG TPA: tol-pal system protein YbgF [Gammaproteobacteria bacterium]|nr:tol-pal system protein YbgF [Gammaproteobacteria bacterium]